MGFKKYVLLIFCVISMTTIDIQTFDDDIKFSFHPKEMQIYHKIHVADSIDDIIALEEDIIALTEEESNHFPILHGILTKVGMALQYSLPNYLNYLLSNKYDLVKNQDLSEQVFMSNIRDLLKKVIANQSNPRIRDRDIQTIEVLTRHGFNWDSYLRELSIEALLHRYQGDYYFTSFIRDYLRENPTVYNAMYLPRPGAVRLPSGKIPHQVPEQTLWDRTKQAWNNVKAEIPKIIDRMPQ